MHAADVNLRHTRYRHVAEIQQIELEEPDTGQARRKLKSCRGATIVVQGFLINRQGNMSK